jgi:hypothetical protein
VSDQESDFSPPDDHDWNEIALGDYTTEKAAEDALDSYLEMLTGFKVYREVVGEILQPRYGAKEKAVRIDRILVPMPSMEQHGWAHGCVGIECKKSGEKKNHIRLLYFHQ